jgi:hypothetical protein
MTLFPAEQMDFPYRKTNLLYRETEMLTRKIVLRVGRMVFLRRKSEIPDGITALLAWKMAFP